MLELADKYEQALYAADERINHLREEIDEIEFKLEHQAAVVEAAKTALGYLDNEPMTGAFEYARQAQAILRQALAEFEGGGDE
jgi:hypothetical protein